MVFSTRILIRIFRILRNRMRINGIRNFYNKDSHGLFVGFFILIFLFSSLNLSAKKNKTDTLSIRNIKSGLSLTPYWKFKTGESAAWMDPMYDDSAWMNVSTDKDDDTLLDKFEGIVSFRVSFYIDSTASGIPLALIMRTNGAFEIFVDGKPVHSIGIVGKTEKEHVSGFSIRSKVIPIPANSTGWHHIAIRASSYGNENKFGMLNLNGGLSIGNFDSEILSMQKSLDEKRKRPAKHDHSCFLFRGIYCTKYFSFGAFSLLQEEQIQSLLQSFSHFCYFLFFMESTYDLWCRPAADKKNSYHRIFKSFPGAIIFYRNSL